MKAYATPISLIGAALALIGGAAYLISPDTGRIGLINLVVGLLLVVAAGFLNGELFRQYSRWLNAFWGGIMVFGILAMVNFLGNRYPQRLDLTEGQLHSLSDLTVETLQNLDRDVEALAFMEGGENQRLELLLAEFSAQGDRFSYEFVDPDRNPVRTEENGIRRYNTLLLKSEGKEQQITDLEEREITNALLKVIRDRQEKIYLSVGHGEHRLGNDPNGLSLLKQRLGDIDYAIQDSLFLARSERVPADCAVLIIAGPRTPFLPTEVEALRAYMQEGGAVLALLDPLYESGLEPLLAEWGVVLGDNFVIDTSGVGSLFGLDFTTPVSATYGDHPITRKHRGVMTFFQLSRSVHFDSSAANGLQGAPLALTSESGWAETDLRVLRGEGDNTVKLDEGVDVPGPVALAVAVEGRGGRLVVFGDSDFATNQYFDYQGNGDLALNALSWLAEDESLISIRPREAGYNPIALNDNQGEWIFWLSVVLYPLFVSLIGLFVVSSKGRWSIADLAGAGLGIALSLGIVVLCNFMGDRYHVRYDLTADRLFTLSDDTARLLSTLQDEGHYVKVKTFMSEMEGMRFQDQLKEYHYLSKNFTYELVDPQKDALQVKQHNIRERGTSIVEVRGEGQVRSERITQQSEAALSNAILKALQARDQKAYFSGGHGEAELDQVDGKGYSLLKGRLRELNFEVESGLDLSRAIPEDATLVVVLGPQERFSSTEADMLGRYLGSGGSALLLLDPGNLTGLEALLDDYSITLGQDFVVDLSGMGQLFGADVSVPVVINYGDHPIAERLGSGTMSFFPLARSVRPAAHRRKGGQVAALALTHQSSWGESDLAPVTGEGGKVEFDPQLDLRGPVSLAVAVDAPADTSLAAQGKTRLVVFGDSDFASNEYFGQQANGDLLVKSVEWLAEGDNRLDIRDKRAAHNPINLIGNQGAILLWISVFVLPFAVALSGLVMVLKRGYQTYADGFVGWLMYSFAANAVFLLISAVVALSEADLVAGQLNTAAGLLCSGVGYGLYRRAAWAWLPALGMALASAAGGFWLIPNETIQLLYAAAFIVNAAILIWIRRTFAGGER